MKKHKFKIALLTLLTIFCIIGWFVPFRYNNEGYCGESPLYKYKFGIYSCEYNAEAHPDFQCGERMGGFWNYIGIKKLECESKKVNSNFRKELNQTTIQDTLTIIKLAIQADFDSFNIVDWIVGDINNDEKKDFVVLIDIKGNRTICLIETFANNPLTLKLIRQNNSLIECSDCGGAGVGDPYRGMTINNGEISFKQLFGACCKDEETVTFTFDEKLNDWFLLKKEKISYCCNQENDSEIKTIIKTETKKDFGTVKFNEIK